jgi:hypothetical protein
MTARPLPALVPPTARAMVWGPLAAGAGLGLVVLIVPEVLATRMSAADLTTLLRIAAACLAVGAAFLLNDPAARSIQTAPTPRLLRHAVRAGLALPAVGAGWGAALAATALGRGAVAAAPPRAGLTLEVAALVALALALAACASRIAPDGNAAVLAGPALLVVLAAVWFAPHRVALVLAPADPGWGAAHLRWAGLLAAAVLLFTWASHEPARHRRPAVADRAVALYRWRADGQRVRIGRPADQATMSSTTSPNHRR